MAPKKKKYSARVTVQCGLRAKEGSVRIGSTAAQHKQHAVLSIDDWAGHLALLTKARKDKLDFTAAPGFKVEPTFKKVALAYLRQNGLGNLRPLADPLPSRPSPLGWIMRRDSEPIRTWQLAARREGFRISLMAGGEELFLEPYVTVELI